jgi:hypothetical protein
MTPEPVIITVEAALFTVSLAGILSDARHGEHNDFAFIAVTLTLSNGQ